MHFWNVNTSLNNAHQYYCYMSTRSKVHGELKKLTPPGLSMNILRMGNKLPLQRGFFKNSTGNFLLTLRFLGGLSNSCNLVIFSLIKLQWCLKERHFWEWLIANKKRAAETASLWKLKTMWQNMSDTLC